MSSWQPILFQRKCVELDCDDKFITQLIEYGNRLSHKGLPVIFSLLHLSKLANSHYSKLRDTIFRTITPYDRFKIQKRSGGYRQIVVPHDFLLVLQKWICNNILVQCKTSVHSKAYSQGSSIFKNAKIHCGANWLIKIDLRRFFESITEKQVYYVFKDMGYTPLLSFELARLCTISTSNINKLKSKRWNQEHYEYSVYIQTKQQNNASPFDDMDQFDYIANLNNFRIGHLPQGAPTSPLLSNLVFSKIDDEISIISKKYKCNYTRYSDDIAFSCFDFDREKAKQLISEVSQLLSIHGFRRNHNKTQIVPPGARKIVTGLVVNSDQPKVQKDIKKRIEKHIYFSLKFGPALHCQNIGFKSIDGFRNHLKGLIYFVLSIDRTLGESYFEQFNKITWPEFI
jgi:RNA-directed DNA polymerase